MKLKNIFLIMVLFIVIIPNAAAIFCGDGVVEGLEECDDGNDNSDTEEDACRVDCSLPHCGDGVTDSGEECDDSGYNDDAMPDACREDCTLPTCGDGVIDIQEGEICDYGADNAEYGCYQCVLNCFVPEDDLVLTEDAKLCPGTYTIEDKGDEGVIIVGGEATTIDCNGAQLVGVTEEIAQANVQTGANQQNMQQINTQNQQQNQGSQGQVAEETAGFFGQFIQFFTNIFTGGDNNAQGPSGMGDAASTIKRGTGILLASDNAVLINCDVTNYMTGVKITATGAVVASSKICGNSRDIDSINTNFGAGNKCYSTANWIENGDKCTYACDGSLNTIEECPECVCEETTEETEQETEETETEETETAVVCPDGTIANSVEECPEEEEEETPEQCNDYTCLDGTCVNSYEDCPEANAQPVTPELIECEDGTVVKDKDDCPQDEPEEEPEEKIYDVCCQIISKTATAVSTDYKKMTNKECVGENGKEVADSYCEEKQEESSCKEGYKECDDGSCVEEGSECTTTSPILITTPIKVTTR